MPRLGPFPNPAREVGTLRDRRVDREALLCHRLRQTRVRGEGLYLQDHQAAAAPVGPRDHLEPVAGRGDKGIGLPHHRRAGGRREHRDRGSFVEDIARIEWLVAGKLPPRPCAVGLVGTEPLADQLEELEHEKGLVAMQHEERRFTESPGVGL